MLDIILTIWAWNRGWRGWSLLPMGIAYFFVFILAAAGAFDTGSFIAIILIELVALIILVAKGRKDRESWGMNQSSPAYSLEAYPGSKSENDLPSVTADPSSANLQSASAKLELPDKTEIKLTGIINPIGRDNLEKVVSSAALNYISRQHLWIRFNGSQYFAEDAGSANGTRVNGIEIKGRGLQELKDGDRINLGDVAALTFRLTS